MQLISSGQSLHASFAQMTQTQSPTAQKHFRKTLPFADWFFHHCIQKFVDAFYARVLVATDFWLRSEWQHCSSPHVHALAWLPDAPDMEQIIAFPDATVKEVLIHYVDGIVSTINPPACSPRWEQY